MKITTREDVVEALRRAAETHRALPNTRPQGFYIIWAREIKPDADMMWDEEPAELYRPTPEDVSDMDIVMNEWLPLIVSLHTRRLVWSRARRVPWKVIVAEDANGYSYAALKREYSSGIDAIYQNIVHGITLLPHLGKCG